MKQNVANYTVIIEQEYRSGTNDLCYSAYVPKLGISTDSDTLEKVQTEIQALIQFHLDSLAQEGIVS